MDEAAVLHRPVAVAVGGGAGAALRVLAGDLAPVAVDPAITLLLINLSGALALGILLRATSDDRWRALLGTGLLGSWTTASTLSVQLLDLVARSWLFASVVAVASVVGGLGAARLGLGGDPDRVAPFGGTT